MAVDKLVDSTQLDSDLTSVANAIRTKGGTSAQLAFPSGFVSAIGDIPTGGSSTTAVIDGNTEKIEWEGFGTKQFTRPLSWNNAKVIRLTGFTNINLIYAFEFMLNLEAFICEDATQASGYLLWNTSLQSPIVGVDFHKQVTFGNTTIFRNDAGVDLILRGDTMSTTQFTASSWAMPPMNFYVPNSLLNDYINGTNWNTFDSSKFHAIEGSKYEDESWWESI